MDALAEQGRTAYKEGRFDEAIAHLESALSRTPDDDALRLMLARSLLQGGHGDRARAQFRLVAKGHGAPELRNLALEALREHEPPLAEALHPWLTRGVIPESSLDELVRARRPDESPMAAAMRLLGTRFTDWLGPHDHPPLVERPIGDRLGMRLLKERLITQVQLKGALAAQAHDHRRIGSLLATGPGQVAARLESIAGPLPPLHPVVAEPDQLGPLLVRWGLLTADQWRSVVSAGGSPAKTLIERRLCLPEHLQRAKAYQQGLSREITQRRFRLGEVLISHALLSRENLGKALAWQVDQPFPLGELLVYQSLCEPEMVLFGLQGQWERYRAEAERDLPPLRPVEPEIETVTVPAPAAAPRRRWGRREAAIAATVLAVLGYAIWYGTRYGEGGYGWLSWFRHAPLSSRRDPNGPSEVRVASDPHHRDGPVAPDVGGDPFTLPESQRAGTPLATEGTGVDQLTNRQQQGLERSSFSGAAAFDRPGATPPPGWDPNSEPAQLSMNANREVYAPLEANAPGRVTYGRQPGTRIDSVRPPVQPRIGQSNEAIPPPSGVPPAPDLPTVPSVGSVPRPAPNGFTRDGQVDPAQGAVSLRDQAVNRATSMFRYRLGGAYFAQGNAASARQEFLSALAADPGNPLPNYYLGRLSETEAHQAEARAYYVRYLAGAPNGEFADSARVRLKRLGAR